MEQLINIQCPGCGTQGGLLGVSKDEEVYGCPNCELCFLAADVRRHADKDNHWYSGMTDLTVNDADKFKNEMRASYRRQYDIYQNLLGRKKGLLCDVGCGLGVFLAIGKEIGWSVTGVEASEYAEPFASKYYGLHYVKSLHELPAGAFDIVRISHVLEHVPEPKEFLNALKRILTKQGLLVVVVPNREPLCATVINWSRRLRRDRPKLVGAIYPDMHVLGFSPLSLTRTVGAVGFKQERVSTISMGCRTYFPLFYDGLLSCRPLKTLESRSLLRYYAPMFIDNLGNWFGKGQWIVGYFRLEC